MLRNSGSQSPSGSPGIADLPHLGPVEAEHVQRLIATHAAVVGVVGQGYVGFGLAQRAAQVGFRTVGVDINPSAVLDCIRRNECDAYNATTDPAVLAECDVILIAVPTPTRIDDGVRHSDLGYVVAAAEAIAAQFADDRRPRLVVSESTYAPGTTREVVMPILRRTRGGAGIAVGYSPERIDPGNGRFDLSAIPKVVSGADDCAAALTACFYRELIDQVVPASSMEAAEATKLLENTFRFVNIAFAQEFDEYCEALRLSSHEITRLAATKPFGYLPFFAGAGVGGHCIAEDPYFLYDSMREHRVAAPLVATAMMNQENRPAVIVRRITERLGSCSIRGAHILVLGVAYKPDIGDTRRSPAFPVIDLLERAGAAVDYHDPHVPAFGARTSVDLESADPRAYDLVVVLTEHSAFDQRALQARGWDPYRLSAPATATAGPPRWR